MTLRAVIPGVTSLIGSNLAEYLLSKGWEVYGVARKPQTGIPGVRPIEADLLQPEALRTALDAMCDKIPLWVGNENETRANSFTSIFAAMAMPATYVPSTACSPTTSVSLAECKGANESNRQGNHSLIDITA